MHCLHVLTLKFCLVTPPPSLLFSRPISSLMTLCSWIVSKWLTLLEAILMLYVIQCSFLGLFTSWLTFAFSQGAVQILSLIQEILPPTASLIRSHLPHGHTPASIGQAPEDGSAASESSNGMFCSANHRHYAIIESDHPYKPATVSNYKVSSKVFLSVVMFCTLTLFLRIIDVKNGFYVFLFFERFLFSCGQTFNSSNLLNPYIKRFLSDEFNVASIGNSLMKRHNSQTLSCSL